MRTTGQYFPYIDNLSQSEKEGENDDLQAKIAQNEDVSRGYQKLVHAEIEHLQAKKGLAKTNLAGATWEEYLSTETNAPTARCCSEIDVRQEENRVLRAQLSKLQFSPRHPLSTG